MKSVSLIVGAYFRIRTVGRERFAHLCQCVRDTVKTYINRCPWTVTGIRSIERVLRLPEVVHDLLNPGLRAWVLRCDYQFVRQRLKVLNPQELLLSLSRIGHGGILDRSHA